PSDCAGIGFPGFHAEDQDPSLVWCHTQHEEHVRHSARREIRMAQEHPSLEVYPREHSRSVRHRSSSLRDCGRHRSHGRQRAPKRYSSSSGKDRTCGRSGGCRCNLRATHGVRARPDHAHSRWLKIHRQRFSCTDRPGWRTRQCPGESLPGGSRLSTSTCILKRSLPATLDRTFDHIFKGADPKYVAATKSFRPVSYCATAAESGNVYSGCRVTQL